MQEGGHHLLIRKKLLTRGGGSYADQNQGLTYGLDAVCVPKSLVMLARPPNKEVKWLATREPVGSTASHSQLRAPHRTIEVYFLIVETKSPPLPDSKVVRSRLLIGTQQSRVQLAGHPSYGSLKRLNGVLLEQCSLGRSEIRIQPLSSCAQLRKQLLAFALPSSPFSQLIASS